MVALSSRGMSEANPAAETPTDTARVAQDRNAFAFDLYAQLAGREGNLFFSPYSISTALAMTYAGARGDTAQQMAKTLHLDLEPGRLHPAFAQLIREQNAAGKKRGYQLTIANALWGQKGFAFQPAFLELIRQNYAAGLQEVDFVKAAEAARRTINAWVEKETQDKIKDLIKEGTLDPDMRLVLTNAIYFKSAWSDPFFEGKEDFFVTAQKKVLAPLMRQTGSYQLHEDQAVQVLDLPYERNDLSLIAVLPRQKDGLAQLEKTLTLAKLEGWLKARKSYQVDVKLPRFKMTQELDLKKTLSELGMPLAFTEAADFSGISSQQKLHIGFVLHKAFIDLDEKGTEAAAATAIGIKATAAPLPPPNRAIFHAHHPFLFVIRDNRSGSVLFMGRVVNPG
jgi:serpin B